jgi:PAS domain S-box-containing protein
VAAFFLAQATVRRRMAEAQAAFGERFRDILENMSLLALGLDREGRIVFSNEALLRLVGHGREALAGRNWLDALVVEAHRERGRALFERMVFTRDFQPRHEFAIRTACGATRLIAWSTARLTDAEGNVAGVTCIGEDITEARRAEQELRKVSRAVEQSPSTVMITDIAGRIEYVNPKFTQLTGYTLDEVRGTNPRVLKSGETSAEEYHSLWRTITSGGEWRGVFHNRKKSGELYWEAACISPIRDAGGAITHLLAVKEDITERRRLEEEIEQRKREAARNQALAEVGRMANMVAHDLRNPLSSVKMTLQIYGRRPAKRWDPEERELQQIALEQVHYMEEILSDLLTYSRPDSFEPEWLDIDRVLEGAILVAQKHVTERGVHITTRYRPGLPKLYGDGAKLRQAFANILENAAQATEGIVGREPEVEIATELELRDDGPWIRIEICDNGAGLASDDLERVFEPFYTTRAKGTGLGLAIVRRMVELHGGTARLQQIARNRTCATVLLPTRAKGEQSAEGQGSEAAETYAAGAAWTLDSPVAEH